MKNTLTLKQQLQWYLRNDQILDSDIWREIYARDASYFNIKPQLIVRPDTTEQVQQILRVCHANGIALTFRSGGTSLSGQTLGSGIICELRTAWNKCQPSADGKKVWFEPGLTANQVNAHLHPHHTHIGPDPASSSAATMGGILSNNSSGMTAGVALNSYHTLSSLEFVLANGHRYNSADSNSRKRFEQEEHDLCAGLMQIRSEILSDDNIRNKIVRKYQIKNVTGYAMCAFVDYDNPLDIFTHLLIGSEGTLAFIVAGELNTIPSLDTYSSSLLYFPDVTTAASHAAWLGESGAQAVEMMDYASLMSSQGLPADMPTGTTALLVDYGASSPEEMAEIISSLNPRIAKLKGLSRMEPFTKTLAERARLWNIRDGVFPCVAGARVPGNAVILEDVVAPVTQLDALVEGVQQLFHKHGYDGAIFGHARAGNIHPLVTADMKSEKAVTNFRRFMDGVVDHVLSLDGSLKGEHGTGRAIAPFVEKEWGKEIYTMMKRVKHLADPHGILNPGVIINDNPDAFIKPLKSLDLFGKSLGVEKADRCMECGYCEHVCPSRYVTLTPRQRLQAQRVIARTGNKHLIKEYQYIGADTCCTDGSCQMPCPMGINTGEVTDAIRAKTNPQLFEKALTAGAPHYKSVEQTFRIGLKTAVLTSKVISPYPFMWGADFLHEIYKQVPHWSKFFPIPPKRQYNEVSSPDFIYFPACVTRIFGGSSFGKDDMIVVMLRIAQRSGITLSLPKSVEGLCCSQIWEHKGSPDGQKISANKTVESFYEMSDNGRIPIICDTTSCTHTLLSMASKDNLLSEENRRKYSDLTIIDITEWLLHHVMPKLKVTSPKKNICLHPTCASKLLKVDTLMLEIARLCANHVTVPSDSHCCGAAGDRGFIFPEVAQGAVRDEKANIADKEYDGYYSLGRTCEISMSSTIGRPYESIVYLVDETTSSL